MTHEVVVTSAVRTAIGTFGGSLKDLSPSQLGALVVREAVHRSSLTGSDVGHVVFGNVVHTEPRDMYLARVAAIDGGVHKEAPALTLNRLCGSGLQAIITAAQAIQLGDTDIAIGGGAESMSRALYALPSVRFGARMGNVHAVDMLLGALQDPFEKIHMGVTAENVARKFSVSRQEQDELALESHRRAAVAVREGYFREQVVPVQVQTRKGLISFQDDEHVRYGATLDDFAKLPPIFAKPDGTVTAGNASGINDGAAAVVLMEAEKAKQRGMAPLGKLVTYAHTGVDPALMGIGPVSATRKALERAGLTIADIDVIESNEAFAAQACAVARELGLDPAKTNRNGSGISLGHPVGATGAILVVKALYELKRTGGRYALVTMCIGGGQGIAAIFENI